MFLRFFFFFLPNVWCHLESHMKQRCFSIYHQNDVLCVCVCLYIYMSRRLAVRNRQRLLLKPLTTLLKAIRDFFQLPTKAILQLAILGG
jgi:hypothetical protein